MDMDDLMIFVVDDDQDVCEASSWLLKAYGWHTRTFNDARDCLAAAVEEPPVCILSDLQMPFMDGTDLMEELLAAGVDVPVVMVTGLTQPSPDWMRAAELATAMVAKPCDSAELNRVISRAVASFGHTPSSGP